MSPCGCSTRKPTANALADILTPRESNILSVSLAECPMASTRSAHGISSPPARRTARTRPPSAATSATSAPKRTSAPSETSSSRIRRQKPFRRSVPTCGLASVRRPGSPANSPKIPTTWETSGSPMRVVSFPSENVPAPPSPNWTLLLGSMVPLFQKSATWRDRSSTGLPRSRRSGEAP